MINLELQHSYPISRSPDSQVDTDEWYLEKDYSINCGSDTYKAFRVYALAMIAVYPIGIPLLYLIMLFPKRRILEKDPSDRTPAEADSVAPLAFLAASYRPSFWFFEVIECFRKLLLSAALIFITPGSATQGIFGLSMAMGSQRLYVGCKQMPDPSDNRLGELAQWQLVFIFLAALLLQMDLSSNVTNYDDVIFDSILVTLLFIGPAISFFEPVMPMICGKKLKLATINLGTVGMAPPAMPQEMKAAMNVANQVANADASQAEADSLSKDPSPLMRRKLADEARRAGSDNTNPTDPSGEV